MRPRGGARTARGASPASIKTPPGRRAAFCAQLAGLRPGAAGPPAQTAPPASPRRIEGRPPAQAVSRENTLRPMARAPASSARQGAGHTTTANRLALPAPPASSPRGRAISKAARTAPRGARALPRKPPAAPSARPASIRRQPASLRAQTVPRESECPPNPSFAPRKLLADSRCRADSLLRPGPAPPASSARRENTLRLRWCAPTTTAGKIRTGIDATAGMEPEA